MKRRNLFVPAGLAVSLLLGGCSILPEQTAEHPNVVVEAVEETSYNLAQVERGDIYLTQKLFFLYTQTKEEAVAFETGGRRVAGVYAKAGDTVKKGQLLAELDGEDLHAKATLASETILLDGEKLAADETGVVSCTVAAEPDVLHELTVVRESDMGTRLDRPDPGKNG